MLDPYKVRDIPAPLQESNARLLQQLHDGCYDFIDLGSNHGGGFQIGARQGGRRGLGFDLQPDLVHHLLAQGHDVACMDIRTLRAPEPLVDFAVCSHVLEHLPSLYDVGGVIGALRNLCRDYLLISGPCFEEEDYLWSLNLKVLHTAMPDHLCRFKVIDLVDMLHRLRLRDYVVALGEPMRDSANPWIHRADEPAEGMWIWDGAKNLPKPHVDFDRPLHRDFVCIVQLRSGIDAMALLKRFYWGYDKIVFRSSWDLAAEV
jgi:hypothetical protein